MFHQELNLFFGRCEDGAVRIVKFETPNGQAPHACWTHKNGGIIPTDHPTAEGTFNDVKVVLDVRIPADHWASIIASGERSLTHRSLCHFFASYHRPPSSPFAETLRTRL